MLTALARVEGRSVEIIANVGAHMGGAIDGVGATKAARFLTLCDAYDIPVVVLADTPGFMVGPESDREALPRHAGRLTIAGANLGVPVGTVAWPTGEFGMTNLEGAVHHGYSKELAAIADEADREARYQELVAAEYAKGKDTAKGVMGRGDRPLFGRRTTRWLQWDL